MPRIAALLCVLVLLALPEAAGAGPVSSHAQVHVIVAAGYEARVEG